MSSYYTHRGASYLSDRAPPPADPGTAAPLVLEDITPQFDNVHHSHSHSHRVKSRNTTTGTAASGLGGTHDGQPRHHHPRHDSRSGRRALAVVEEQNVDHRSAHGRVSHVSTETPDQQTHEKFPRHQPQAAVHPSSQLRSAHVEADPAFKPPSWLANAALGGDSVRSRQHDHPLQDPRYQQQFQDARLQEQQQQRQQQQQQQQQQVYARGQYLRVHAHQGHHLSERSDADGSFRPDHAEVLSQSHVDETVRREDLRRRSHDGLHRTHRQRLFDAALLSDGNDNGDDGAVHQHVSRGTHHRHGAHRHKHHDRASAHHHSAAHGFDGHEDFMTHEVRKQNHGPHRHVQALTHLDRQGVGTTRPVRRTSRPLCLSQESSGKRSRDEDDAVASPDDKLPDEKNEAAQRHAQVPREPFGDTNDTAATSSQLKRNDGRAHRHHHDRERKGEMNHTKSVEQEGSGKEKTMTFGGDVSDDSDVDPIPSIPPIVSIALSPSKWKARVAALVRDDPRVKDHHHRAQNQTQSNNLTAATTAEAVHLLSIVLEREAAREVAAHKYAVKLQRSITALRHTVVRAAPMLQFQATGPRRMTTLGHLQFCFNKMAPIATSSSSPAFEPSAPSVPASVPDASNVDSVANGRNDDDVDAPSTTKPHRDLNGSGEARAALPLHQVFKDFVSRKTRSDASLEDGAAPHEPSDTEPDDLSLAMKTAVCLAASTFLSCPIPTTASEGPGPEPTRSLLSMLFSELTMDHVTAFSLRRNVGDTDSESTNQHQTNLPNGSLFFLDTTTQRSSMKSTDNSFSSLLNDVLRSMTAAGLAAAMTTPSPSPSAAATTSQPPREAAEPIGCQLLHRLRRCITSPEDARAHLTQEAVALLLRVFALWLSVPLHVSQEIGHVDNIGEILGEHALIVVKSLQDEERGSVHRLCDIQLGSFSHAAHCGGADRAPSKVAVDRTADAPSSTLVASTAVAGSAPTDTALRRPTLRELFLEKTAKKKKTSDGNDRKHEDVDAEEVEVEDDRSIGFSMMRLRSTTSSSVSMSMPGSGAPDALSEQEAIQRPRNSLGTDDNGATKAEAAPVSRVGRGRGRGRRLHGALASSSPSTSPSKQKSSAAVPEGVKEETLPAASALSPAAESSPQHTTNAFVVGAASTHDESHVQKFGQPTVTGTRPLLSIHRQRVVTREDFDVFLSGGSDDSSGAAASGPFNLRRTAVEDKKETANPNTTEPISTRAADGAAAATMIAIPSSVIEVSSLFEAAVFLHATTARLALFCLKAFPAALPPATVDATAEAAQSRASWSAEVAEMMSVREAMASSVSNLFDVLERHLSSPQVQRRNKGLNTKGANEEGGAACEDEDAVAPSTDEAPKSPTALERLTSLEAALRDVRELSDMLT